MLVPSMTDLEILEEMKKDHPQIRDYISYLNTGRKYRKLLQDRKPKGDMFVFVIEDWKSRRNNHYTFVLSTRSLGDLKKHGFTYANLTFLKRGSNLCAYRLVKNSADSDEIGLEICSSHFIERYNQRFLRKPELSHKQAFVEFYKRNPICNILPLPSEVHDFNHMAACRDGFCFEKMENDTINVLRTFISHDMLKGSQYDTADLAVETVRASLAGIISNMSSCEEELDRVCNGEQKIPTMDDYNYCMKLCDQLREKKVSLEKEGKPTDLEYAEMRNRLTIYIAGFDWAAAMQKDENDQLVRHPLDFYQ